MQRTLRNKQKTSQLRETNTTRTSKAPVILGIGLLSLLFLSSSTKDETSKNRFGLSEKDLEPKEEDQPWEKLNKLLFKMALLNPEVMLAGEERTSNPKDFPQRSFLLPATKHSPALEFHLTSTDNNCSELYIDIIRLSSDGQLILRETVKETSDTETKLRISCGHGNIYTLGSPDGVRTQIRPNLHQTDSYSFNKVADTFIWSILGNILSLRNFKYHLSGKEITALTARNLEYGRSLLAFLGIPDTDIKTNEEAQ